LEEEAWDVVVSWKRSRWSIPKGRLRSRCLALGGRRVNAVWVTTTTAIPSESENEDWNINAYALNGVVYSPLMG
jgi:hypothetical protein